MSKISQLLQLAFIDKNINIKYSSEIDD